jgi:hypothetical protein
MVSCYHPYVRGNICTSPYRDLSVEVLKVAAKTRSCSCHRDQKPGYLGSIFEQKGSPTMELRSNPNTYEAQHRHVVVSCIVKKALLTRSGMVNMATPRLGKSSAEAVCCVAAASNTPRS